MDKGVLGYIDCPTCGTSGGMRITNDKNGHPFGFCTATCRQQLRVGPDPERVAAFVERYPFAAAKPAATPAPAPAVVSAPAPVPVARKRSGLADALQFLGGGAA
ncbi:hypothetical protein [Hydrogenophaga sp.]|uniref:hypothetical protein n=1 Tax=Hydrogenophaga sp. TaxID=1904254 RepID=UPI003D0A604A